jgi:3-oxoacyl-[acyl-carrier-protein] synthase II
VNPLSSARPASPASITGIGVVSGYGWGRDALWRGLSSGRSAVVDQPDLAARLGRESYYLARVSDPDPDARTSLFGRALLGAVGEAVADARERGWEPGPSVGVVHCAVLGDIYEMRDFYNSDAGESRPRHKYLKLLPSTPLSMLMQQHHFHGPAMAVGAMCASGNAGLLTAMAWLDAGLATDVVVAATDISLTDEHVRQFVDLGVAIDDAPSLDVCRPFQKGSRGFTAGEASVAFVLTRRPGAGYATLLGGSMTHDGHHVTNVDPSHHQIHRVVAQSLQTAGVEGYDVAYLNAHGPGTAQCDAAESAVSAELLPNASLYSLKPLVGHCQGAASLVEAAGACLGYEHGTIPAPWPVADGDARLLQGPTPVKPGLTVKTSIGLGGHNSAIVLSPAA